MSETGTGTTERARRRSAVFLAALTLCLLLAVSLTSCGGKGQLLPINSSDGFGYIDRNGKVIIEPRYQWAEDFSEGLAAVMVEDRWGFIDASGKTVIEPQYAWAGSFHEKLAVVEMEGKFGYIDESGYLAVGPLFDLADDFQEGLAVVKAGGKYGFIDASGNVVLELGYDWAGHFSEGLALVLTGTTYGYIDQSGVMVIELPTPASLPLSSPQASPDGGAEVELDIAQWQKLLSYCAFSGGLAVLEKDGKYGYIDRSGETVMAPQFDSADSFSEGLAAVRSGRRWGFVDTSGSTVIDAKFDQAGSFSQKLAPVRLNGIWGYINPSGQIAIDPKFDYAYAFASGLAPVTVGETKGYIDRQGDYVWRPTGPETDLSISRPSRIPLIIIYVCLALSIALLVMGMISYFRMLRMFERGEEEQVVEVFLQRYHSSGRMQQIKRGPFVLDEHLEKLERNNRIYILVTLAFMAVLWLPNLIYLSATGRGIFNYFIFHKNGFPGDDWSYNLLGTFTLLLFLAFCLVQRTLLKKLLDHLASLGADEVDGE
jgi:hypothetical protein